MSRKLAQKTPQITNRGYSPKPISNGNKDNGKEKASLKMKP